VGLIDFKASPRWIHRFKTKNWIGSRKITKVVSKKQLNNAEDIKKTAEMFVATVRKDLEEADPENLLVIRVGSTLRRAPVAPSIS